MKSVWFAAILLALAGMGAIVAVPARADDDRRAGYYYPEPKSSEVYIARATTLQQASRSTRIGFLTGLTNKQLAAPYPPQFAAFAKGDDADRMIIVALADGQFSTLYRARALLAQLTAMMRGTDLFRQMGVEDFFTFFDMAKMFGFKEIVVSDGESFAHRIEIE